MDQSIGSSFRPSPRRLHAYENADASNRPTEQTSQTDQTRNASALSPEEKEMITDLFPSSQETRLRIYGPESNDREVNPNELGNNLDLTG